MRQILILPLLLASLCPGAQHKTRHVILVTADGLRWQDLFGGIDATLMNEKAAGMSEAKAVRERFWKETAEERRETLMPFLWKELAPKGVIFGNVTKGSSALVSNSFRVSYPGYSEILTGRAQDEVIRGNTPIRQPTPTIFELVREKLKLPRSQVALFGTWDVFHAIGEHTPGSVVINAGPKRFDEPNASARARELSELQYDLLVPWGGERHDYITFELALDYLKHAKPRLMHIAFGETDDWAHDKKYDRVLESIAYFDRSLRKLWSAVQSMPEYRDRTTLVITTDHGRGSLVTDFSGHGARVEGANQIWMAFLGPDTPALGEMKDTAEVMQRDIAPTILELMGIDPGSYDGVLGKRVAAAIR